MVRAVLFVWLLIACVPPHVDEMSVREADTGQARALCYNSHYSKVIQRIDLFWKTFLIKGCKFRNWNWNKVFSVIFTLITCHTRPLSYKKIPDTYLVHRASQTTEFSCILHAWLVRNHRHLFSRSCVGYLDFLGFDRHWMFGRVLIDQQVGCGPTKMKSCLKKMKSCLNSLVLLAWGSR